MIDRNHLTEEQKELIIQVANELINNCGYMEDTLFGIGYIEEAIKNIIEEMYPEINLH